jgi:hypothetical protein
VRRFASASAFCGIVLYSALIPGHIVSQATFGAARAGGAVEVASIAPVVCHSDLPGRTPSPGSPAAPQKRCPFCAGYAAFAVASLALPGALIVAEKAAPAHVTLETPAVRGAQLVPHNRGPPHLPA